MDDLLQTTIIDVRILDVFDILIVAYLLYRIFKVLKGSIAFNIFIGVVLLYLVYWLVEVLQMSLLSLLLGKFVGFGVLILIIIFQPEIRTFLLALGNSTLKGRMRFVNKWLNPSSSTSDIKIEALIHTLSIALKEMSEHHTGALLIYADSEDVEQLAFTGTKLNAKISTELLLNIFFKNSPLHDGAVLLNNETLIAASCILPVTKRVDIPSHLGLRHRAAIGITEQMNVVAIVVSEENGVISIAKNGRIKHISNNKQLKQSLTKALKK